MSGIRVKDLSSECTEKDIKIFFSKPENHGGPIGEIYFPLLKGHAVIIFKNSDTAEKVISCGTHLIKGKEIRVEPIPFPQVFTMLEAKFDPSVAALIQGTEHINDEIKYNKSVEFLYDETQCLTGVRGNWYLLEWVRTYIEQISRQQKNARRRSKPLGHHLKEPRSPSPMDTGEPIISMPSSTKIEKDKTTAEKVEDSFKNKAKSNEPTKAPPAAAEGESCNKENIRSCKDGSDKESLETRKILEGITDLKISEASQNVNDIIILSDKADIQTIEFQYGPLTIKIYTGMITLAETDAIVNAANSYLGHYGGVADAIATAAGKEMQRECDQYKLKFGSVPTTRVMHTSAGGEFSPNVKYIMHAVGPICSETRPEKDAVQLTQTFLNSIKYGNDVLKINSVTMPAISSGVFGCPLETCVRSFFNAVLLFASEHMGDSVHLREVHLVNKDGNNTALTVMQLREVILQGSEKLVSEAQQQIQEAEEEDVSNRISRVTGHRLELDQESDYGCSSLPANVRPITTSGSGSSFITSFEAGLSPTSDETRGTKAETSPAFDDQRTAATKSHNSGFQTEYRVNMLERDSYMTKDRRSEFGVYGIADKDRIRAFEVSKRPISESGDMYDVPSRFTNISRDYDSLYSSGSSNSRFSDPVDRMDREKISVTSPGSSKHHPPTSNYLYEEERLHVGGAAGRTSSGSNNMESQRYLPRTTGRLPAQIPSKYHPKKY